MKLKKKKKADSKILIVNVVIKLILHSMKCLPKRKKNFFGNLLKINLIILFIKLTNKLHILYNFINMQLSNIFCW